MKHPHIVSLLVAASAAGCYGYAGTTSTTSAQVQPAGPMDVENPSPDIDTAPQVIYDGRPTYLYRDRWYYRDDGGRWQYHRTEPNELQEHRRNFNANRQNWQEQHPRGNVDRDRNRARDFDRDRGR